METTLIWGLYALWFATIFSSGMVIGYVWRIRHERINEALNTGRFEFDPLARPLAPVDQGADHIDFGWCGRAGCNCGHDYVAGVPACDADPVTLVSDPN